MIALKPIGPDSAPIAQSLVHAAFAPLLARYRDEATSPANKSLAHFERVLAREGTDGYLILHGDETIGYVRVDRKSEGVYSLSDLCILPERQNRGLGQQAVRMIEALYPNAKAWCLQTIKQEARDCHLYEKLGYICLGETQQVNERLTLVFYFKLTRSDVRIRLLREDDYDAARALYEQVQSLHTENLSHIFAPTEVFDRDFFAQMLSTSGATLVAELDGRVVALCVMQCKTAPNVPTFQPRRYAYVDDLCVDEACRRRGIGRSLMTAVFMLARAHGVSSIELNVWGFNESAIRFYESLGMTCQRMQMECRL